MLRRLRYDTLPFHAASFRLMCAIAFRRYALRRYVITPPRAAGALIAALIRAALALTLHPPHGCRRRHTPLRCTYAAASRRAPAPPP